jgi:uncharacterized protein (DUF983 family)
VERLTAGKAYGQALRLRCPVCGQGRLFRRMTMLKHCPHCGFRYEREPGYFTNTVAINYGVACLPIFFIVAPLAYLHPHSAMPIIGLGFFFAIVLPLVCFRHVRSLWLATDLLVRPPVPSEFDAPDEPAPSLNTPGASRI